MIIITDNLKKPFDEGAKIATKMIVEYLKGHYGAYVISLYSNDRIPVVDASFSINRLLLNSAFFRTIKKQPSKKILYIPSGSARVFPILRSRLLTIFTGKEVYLLAAQPQKYCLATRYLIKTIHPKLIIVLSEKTARHLNGLKIPSVSLPLGIDGKKYFEFDAGRKKLVREKYNIAPEKTVLLHVGHIQYSRNLDWLMELKRKKPELEIIVIGSSYNKDDKVLYSALTNEGIRIIREYVPSMVDIYNLADFYIFPVLRQDGAIETPLSVLEAMACNLPVISTKFGSLPDTFAENEDFHYVNSSKEIVEIIKNRGKKDCHNRQKIMPFTWSQIANKLAGIIEKK